MFRNIVFASCMVGVLVGLVVTGLQLLVTVPIILEAETYESGGHTHGSGYTHGSGDTHGSASHIHGPGGHTHGPDGHMPGPDGHTHAGQSEATGSMTGAGGVFSRLYRRIHSFQHAESDWGPENGWQRSGSTLVANILIAIAFSLLLAAAFSLRPGLQWPEGLLWGLGGYAAFFALPALGLPPEIPGSFAADLVSRQSWWLLTALCSAVGLALIVLQRPWVWKIVGAVLVVAPHLLGAPQPEIHGGTAPAALADAFIWRAALINVVFWLLLGGLGAWTFLKLADRQERVKAIGSTSNP
ncbi:CbtA family protein [Candidatus Thiosymbion oneisti]|uniref:CbtA family protein n=1 Tax=Candidatus Thiosymbion oneisti TaxID=589554 RepID=UPI00159F1E23|nr:CbtA family protein [Candidatus Thiosymbion oneisti]